MSKYSSWHHNQFCKAGVQVRAIALWVMLKNTWVNGAVIDWTYEKIAAITGSSRATAKKYITFLANTGMIVFEDSGKKRRANIRLASILCRHGRNINLNKFSDYRLDKNLGKLQARERFKQLCQILLAIHIIAVERRKDKVKDLIRIAQDPKPGEDLKKARRVLRKMGYSADTKFADKGLSYKKIAEYMGCSVATAFKYVALANNILYTKSSGATKLPKWCREMCDYLPIEAVKQAFFKDGLNHKNDKFFMTRYNLYWCRANRYSVTDTARGMVW